MTKTNVCLCCGKQIVSESQNGWHLSCIKKFFGTTKLPELEVTSDKLKELALLSVSNRIAVTGVQKKMSLHLISGKNIVPRLTAVNYPSGYILKPQTEDYPELPQAENLVMNMASVLKIPVVPHALITLKDNTLAYITKRIDRNKNEKIPMEDFCQLSERLTEDKYKGSYEQCGKIIKSYSAIFGLDEVDFFNRIVFCFVTGNSDMHLKNFSLIKQNGKWSLSPTYDLLPVNIVNPQDTEETALNLNGKKSNIKRSDFILLAELLGINSKSAEKLLERAIVKEENFVNFIAQSFLSDDLKNRFAELVKERCGRLKG